MNLNKGSVIVCLWCQAYPLLVFSASEPTLNPSAQPSKLVLNDKNSQGSSQPLADTFWTAYFEAEHLISQTGKNKVSAEYFP